MKQREFTLNHRLDSLARIALGDDVCAAACYIKDSLYLTTNRNPSLELVEKMTSYMNSINNHTIQFLIDFKQNSEKAKSTCKNNITESFRKFITLIKSSSNHNIRNDVKKITDSIIRANLLPSDEKAFEPGIMQAIRNKRIVSIPKIEGRNKTSEGTAYEIHAEMKILEELFRKRIIQNAVEKKEKIYVGITKKCCPNCTATIKAVNKVFGNDFDDIIVVETRNNNEGHNLDFGAGIPRFLTNDPQEFHILKKQQDELIKEIMGSEEATEKIKKLKHVNNVKTLEHVFNHYGENYSVQDQQTQYYDVSPLDSPLSKQKAVYIALENYDEKNFKSHPLYNTLKENKDLTIQKIIDQMHGTAATKNVIEKNTIDLFDDRRNGKEEVEDIVKVDVTTEISSQKMKQESDKTSKSSIVNLLSKEYQQEIKNVKTDFQNLNLQSSTLAQEERKIELSSGTEISTGKKTLSGIWASIPKTVSESAQNSQVLVKNNQSSKTNQNTRGRGGPKGRR